jgi:hypothetical protein
MPSVSVLRSRTCRRMEVVRSVEDNINNSRTAMVAVSVIKTRLEMTLTLGTVRAHTAGSEC